jgi:hypothetical protein
LLQISSDNRASLGGLFLGGLPALILHLAP